MTSTSTRTPIYKAFARGENIGDITAKGECVSNLADLVCELKEAAISLLPDLVSASMLLNFRIQLMLSIKKKGPHLGISGGLCLRTIFLCRLYLASRRQVEIIMNILSASKLPVIRNHIMLCSHSSLQV